MITVSIRRRNFEFVDWDWGKSLESKKNNSFYKR